MASSHDSTRRIALKSHGSTSTLHADFRPIRTVIARYTVIGQPVDHSLSPAIHHLFAELTQRRIRYTRTPATAENFADTVADWQRSGAQGCNITLPFKQQALELCDRLSPAAQAAAAVNTIHMHRNGKLVGHNTDGSGLCTDIERNLGVALADKRLLLLGAGGAARGVVGPLLKRVPASITIANRTAARAAALADDFQATAGESEVALAGVGYDALDDDRRFDLIINATSLSLQGEVPPLPAYPFADDALGYDMMYGREQTSFMRWSREAGAARVAGGFGMLVEQAADAFLVWEGVRPKVRMASARLRAILHGHDASGSDESMTADRRGSKR